jgi:hypothetical protein
MTSTKQEYQRPEGQLIENALRMKKMSGRAAAAEAGISDARWRQIVNGYMSAGEGQALTVVGPPDTVARMARVVGVTPDQLRDAGRADAADLLLTLGGMQAEAEWRSVGTALDRLIGLHEELGSIIADLAAAPGTPSRGSVGEGPAVEVADADE